MEMEEPDCPRYNFRTKTPISSESCLSGCHPMRRTRLVCRCCAAASRLPYLGSVFWIKMSTVTEMVDMDFGARTVTRIYRPLTLARHPPVRKRPRPRRFNAQQGHDQNEADTLFE